MNDRVSAIWLWVTLVIAVRSNDPVVFPVPNVRNVAVEPWVAKFPMSLIVPQIPDAQAPTAARVPLPAPN